MCIVVGWLCVLFACFPAYSCSLACVFLRFGLCIVVGWPCALLLVGGVHFCCLAVCIVVG